MTSDATALPAARRLGVHVALLLVQVWFASLSTVAKLALRELTPTALIAARVPLAALVFLAVWAAQGCERVAPVDLARIAVYAFFGIVLNQLLFIEGLARTTATNAVVLGASIPVFTVAIALLLRRERATPLKLVGLTVAFAGALGVTAWSGVPRSGGAPTASLAGNLLVVANSLSYSIYLVVSRGILLRYRATTVIAFTFAFGALGVLPFGAADLIRAAPTLSPSTWLALAYIVVFPSVGTYLFNAFALARVESSLVAIYIFVQPVLGAALAAAKLGERPTVATLVGGAGIFAGIALVTLGLRPRRPPAPPVDHATHPPRPCA